MVIIETFNNNDDNGRNGNTGQEIAGLAALSEYFPTEQSCRDFLEKARWGCQIICPHCGSDKVHKYTDGKLYWCSACNKQFTVKVGTIFEDSQLPLRKWFFAIFVVMAHKKGISSCQLSRDINVTQKTAWHMLHRIRSVVKSKWFKAPLRNTVEVDETYVGGRSRRLGDVPLKRGRGSERKTPVVAAIERGGQLINMPIKSVDSNTLQTFVKDIVEKGSRVMTDEFASYQGLNGDYSHQTINHSKNEFVRGEVHVNTAECYFSHYKRGIVGIYHHISRKHMHRYCDEFGYRFNTRRMTDGERFVIVLANCEGQLTYEKLVRA